MARLCSEDRLLVEKMVVRYRKSGLLLPEPQQRRLRDINALVDHAISAFSICVNNSTPQLLFSRLELDGLPDSFFAGRATADQPGGAVVVAKYVVSLTKCNVAAILRSAAMENTRKAVYVAVNTRCPENIQRLQDTVDLRQEKARILSYESHSHLVLEGLAAKSPQGVLRMLNDLHERLKPRAQRELQMLGAMKRSDCESSGRPYVGFFEWDAAYYMRIATERTHQVNSANVKQYFPVAGTVARMLGLAEQLLGLRFVRAERPNAWHTAVELYEVWGSSGFLGHCYMDLFSRPGKYTGAANIVIRSGFTRPNGTREFPAVALVTNFAPPPLSTIDSPSLLSHANVKTLFHELGHALHHLCSHTKWSVFHGTNVSRDFLECPSQLMENLVWEPSVLRKLGKHHQSGEPIPENIIGWLVAARNQYPGIFYLSKVFRATYDITIYSAPPDTVVDVRGLLQEMEKDIALCNTGGVETISAAT
ncbi:metalloendopeptidase, partial [Coemansia erecta]